MLRDGFLRFCDDPEIACCRAEAELGQLRIENTQLRDQLAELQELAKARAEGRVAMLPCKTGDTVYAIDHPTLSAINPVPVLTDWEIAEKPFAIEDLSKVGKTVFLTREEAEKSIGSDTQGL